MTTSDNFAQVFREIKVDFKKASAEAERDLSKIIIQTFADIQTFSPVATGIFRARSRVTFARPGPSTIEGKRFSKNRETNDQKAQKRMSDALALLKSKRLKDWGTVSIVNDMRYAEALEHGHSMQAPKGIFTPAGILAQARIERLR